MSDITDWSELECIQWLVNNGHDDEWQQAVREVQCGLDSYHEALKRAIRRAMPNE